jgi:predicted dehydrogenase
MVGGGQGAFIGAVHRMAAALDQQIELVAGCFSRDFENTKQTGKELDLSEDRLYKSYEEMAQAEAKRSDGIDFVSIVTPNKTHFPISKAFLDAGIHVVCDKPMTYSLEEAEQLVKLVEQSGLVFGLTHNYTGNPLVREARQYFSRGEMGTVRKAVVEYIQDALAAPLEKQGNKQISWRTDPSQSGVAGTLGDVGTHALNLLEYVTGDEVTELCADTTTFLPDRELEEDANVLVRLKGGGKGVITVSQVAIGEENGLRMKVYGSEGSVTWDQENPNYLNLFRFGKPRQVLTRNQGYLSDESTSISRVPPGHPEAFIEAFANVYLGAAEAIQHHIDGKPMKPSEYRCPTVYDGLRGMKFVTRAVESAKAGGTWVKL